MSEATLGQFATNLVEPATPKKVAALVNAQPRYRSPAGYFNWKQYLKMLGFYWKVATNYDPHGYMPTSGTFKSLGVTAYRTLTHKAPAIYVSRDLAEALLNTSVPPIPDDLPSVLPAVHFMLPKGVFPTEVEGHSIYAIAVDRVSRKLVRNATEKLGNVVFRFNACSTECEAYTAVIGSLAGEYGVETFHDQNPEDEFRHTYEVMDVCKQVEAFGVNLMLMLTYQPDMLTTEAHGSVAPKGFHVARDHDRRRLPITWLGKDFKPKKLEASEPKGGTHASPQAHWRRGHWHTVLHGEGRKQKRMRWFQPVYVGGN